MKARHLLIAGTLIIAFAPIRAQQAALPSDDAIRAILRNRIDTESRGVGIVVGVLEPAGQRVIAHGGFSATNPRPVDGDTLFEIGSVTKVFTSLLLADLVERGEVQLDDPVAKYLPPSVRVPDRDGRAITLQDLATHTSALPRLPGNLVIRNADNPYADYDAARLYEFLSGYTLTRGVGTQFEYSNVGGGLLGHALALRAGSTYEALARARIFAPLSMSDTTIRLSAEQLARLAPGHNVRREPYGNWDFDALAAAGAIRSTANDMLRLIAAFARERSPIAAARQRMLSVRRPGPGPGTAAALGWFVTTRDGDTVIWHGGATGGYTAFAGYVPSRGTGLVVLSNMAPVGGATADDIGMHLLDSRFPLVRAPAPRTRITLPNETLQRYAGRYAFAPGVNATVTLTDGRLFVQPTGQPQYEIFAESERQFFTTIVDAQFTFEVDPSGQTTAMVLHQSGKDITGKRLAESDAAVAPVRQHITLEPEILDRYVGRYQLTPAVFITVTRENAQLFAQVAGQSRFELFAETSDQFFAKVGGIEVTFALEGSRLATWLTIRQSGTAYRLKRVE
jgi:CubicO group peptidase (beta-lactamase class C family)